MATLKMPNPARRLPMSVVAIVLGALLISGALLWQQQQVREPATLAERMAPMPVSSEIEAKYGVRISQVALIADRGLADLRYTVIDPDKAALMTDSIESLPTIVANNGTVLDQRGAAHRHGQNLEAGTTYFLLYSNVKNSLRPGDTVIVRVGDLTLNDVPVR
ncbi:hypothetical protein K2Z83_16325 [Oscillochloris sp. ZM17-4]|uniref:hypothetical protein n=1 Tax=Oscillochloris sp. ZM17-4 TaxID=2866714 RepID=UPI001C731C54|nr:hypothetical protein [Oscillochloris sp. ZM17-4]MBX0329241.1 hypothetical protein [Oscillochloris sp. ZM17-4]